MTLFLHGLPEKEYLDKAKHKCVKLPIFVNDSLKCSLILLELLIGCNQSPTFLCVTKRAPIVLFLIECFDCFRQSFACILKRFILFFSIHSKHDFILPKVLAFLFIVQSHFLLDIGLHLFVKITAFKPNLKPNCRLQFLNFFRNSFFNYLFG